MTILDRRYAQLADEVLRLGVKRPSRVGETISLPGLSLTTPPVFIEFPIITTRKVFPRGIVGELAAFLQGADMLEEFKEFGCNYWTHNASQWERNKGKPEAEWEVGKVYGNKWRHWGPTNFDQLTALIDGMKCDPYGRRHLLTTWDPADLHNGCLPPCHLLAQFYIAGTTIDCIVTMRSVDIALGLPSDLVLYGVLLMLVAKELDLVPGRLHFHFGDAHIYCAHLDGMWEQLMRSQTTDLAPKGRLLKGANLFEFKPSQFELYDYIPMEAINYELF